MSTRTLSLRLCKCYVDCAIICICLATLDYPFCRGTPHSGITICDAFAFCAAYLLSICLLGCSFHKEQQSRQAMRARHKDTTRYVSTSERAKSLGRLAHACLTKLLEPCILCISYTHLSLQSWQVQSRPHPSNGILRSKVIVLSSSLILDSPSFTAAASPRPSLLHMVAVVEESATSECLLTPTALPWHVL